MSAGTGQAVVGVVVHRGAVGRHMVLGGGGSAVAKVAAAVVAAESTGHWDTALPEVDIHWERHLKSREVVGSHWAEHLAALEALVAYTAQKRPTWCCFGPAASQAVLPS